MAKKAKKITKDELSLINGLVSNINHLQMQIGNIEFQKKLLIDQIVQIQTKIQQNNLELKKKYGDVQVNVQDGTIKPAVHEKLNS
jgi:hypothetical protein